MDDLFRDYGFVSCGILNVTPVEAFELCRKGAIIVDVREEYLTGFKNPDVPSVIFIPFSRFYKTFSDLPLNEHLIIADTVGLRSKESVVFLKKNGYTRIANLAGGIVDWERDGLPLKTNISDRLSGSCICQLRNREGGEIHNKSQDREGLDQWAQ